MEVGGEGEGEVWRVWESGDEVEGQEYAGEEEEEVGHWSFTHKVLYCALLAEKRKYHGGTLAGEEKAGELVFISVYSFLNERKGNQRII